MCPFEWVNVYKSTHKVCKDVQNKLWNCVTLRYMLGKNTVDKQCGVIITKGSQISKRQTNLPTKTAVVNAQKKLGKNQSDSDSDFEDNLTLSEIANVIRLESSDSEFEECLPLCEIVEVEEK